MADGDEKQAADEKEVEMVEGNNEGEVADNDNADEYGENNFLAIVEEYTQEYTTLNSTLDRLDSCLNTLEDQNDSLFNQVQDLLASSIAVRLELQQQNKESGASGEHQHQ